MSADPRLKGQEMQIRATYDPSGTGQPILLAQLDSIASFNDSLQFEIKDDGFLGEGTNRKDSVLNGYEGDIEFQVHDASWLNFQLLVEQKATRVRPSIQFNLIRTDLFANGSSAVITYPDVSWGKMDTGAGGRADFVKVKAPFACSERNVQINQV